MTDDAENAMTRREAMSSGGAVAGSALVSKYTVAGATAMQTGTEPRIQLGGDWEIDDVDDGSGNTDLRLRHQPSGASIRYDVSQGNWVLNTLDATTVTTDELDIGGSRFVSDGNFVAVGPVQTLLTNVTTTSTSYVQITEADVQFTWDTVIPTAGQGAVYAIITFGTGSTSGDFRIFQFADSETLIEFTNFTGAKEAVTNYTPTSSGSTITLRWQFKTDDGAQQTEILSRSTAMYGVQL